MALTISVLEDNFMPSLQIFLDETLLQLENFLNNHINSDLGSHKLTEAAKYALFGGGKRIRPLLTLATAKVLNIDFEHVISAAAAIELIHTYSLVHDDLPCMDNDDYRRGRLTVHRHFDEATAVLVGDFLLTKAFEIISSDIYLSSDLKVKLIQNISRSAGCAGMLGGQMLDLEYENKKANPQILTEIHYKKTTALIALSVNLATTIGNIFEPEAKILSLFAHHLGAAFQIRDDIIDITDSRLKHGSTYSSDITNNKSTYVSIYGLSASKDFLTEQKQAALNQLSQLKIDTYLLAEMTKFYLQI